LKSEALNCHKTVDGFRLALFRLAQPRITAATLLIANLKGSSRIKRFLKQEVNSFRQFCKELAAGGSVRARRYKVRETVLMLNLVL